MNDSVPSVTITPPADTDSPLPSSVEPELSEFTPAIPATNEPADALPDQPSPLEDASVSLTNHRDHTPSISSSSIDVLGTLLRYILLVSTHNLL
jgi:hypothetical protein